MKNFKRFIVIILAICAVMVCASCKKCSKDKNRLIPTLSDPTGTYLKIGNYTITKKDVYYQLLNSYGTEVLLNMVDDALLPALSDEEGFQEYLDEIIYGDEEKTDEVKQKFLDELILSGLSKNPEDDNYYETYYRLVYRRLEYGKKYFKDHMEEDYFKDEDIEKAFENTYRKTNDLIIIRFDSRNEANYFMTSNNIDLNYLNTGWQKTDGTKYTKDEILAIFENIYKDINNVNESGLKTYTYEDLTTINSSLANAVYNWKDGDYSKAPTIYGSDLYLIYKSTESGNLDEDGNVKLAHSISAGLDYPGIGPEHAYLHDIGRAQYVPITDDEAVNAFEYIAKTEGIICAIESAHAVAYVMKQAPKMSKDDIIICCLSGRGDKDVAAIARYRGKEIYE